MNVSDATKLAFSNSSTSKYLTLEWWSDDTQRWNAIPMSNIVSESLTLKESLMSSNNIEFVGCIASEFSLDIYDVAVNLKNKLIAVSICANNTDTIRLFNGIVDSCVRQSNRKLQRITAYDALYTKGQIDVADWYNGLFAEAESITLGELRSSLFTYLDWEQENVELPCDNIVIHKQYEPQSLQALVVLKSICQLNGCFGVVSRQNKFTYRFINTGEEGLYPSITLYPSLDLYPRSGSGGGGEMTTTTVGYYKSVAYEDWAVNAITKVTIRDNESDTSPAIAGEGTNNYIVQGNMFAYKLDAQSRTLIATKLLDRVGGFVYTPFTAVNYCQPWLEVGLDAVEYAMYA